MACLRYLQLVALAIVGSQAIPFSPLLGATPFLTGHPIPEKKPLSLTCSWVDSAQGDAIAVTIKEKQSGYGGLHDALLSHVGGFGGLSGKGKLMATIDLFSSKGGPLSIAFTEKARPERGCHPEDFGSILKPKGGLGAGIGLVGIGGVGGLGGYGAGYGSGYGAGYGAGYGGYGAGYGAAGYGLSGGYGGLYGGGVLGGALGGLGGIGGIGLGGHGYGVGPHGDEHLSIPGVIADLQVSPGTASTVNIDNLSGFDSLKELAGRGVIVCPTGGIENSHYGATCEGYIPACCALHYDMGEQRLNVGAGPYPGGHP